jgi:small conductance mechanosensitive channel
MNPDELLQYRSAVVAWAENTVPTLVGAALLGWVGWWAIGKANKALMKTMGLRRVDPGLITFLSTLFVLGTRALLFITVAGQLGFPTTSLAAVVGAVGLAVGFALQGSLANLAGGVLILLFKPYRVGDRITASGHSGAVKEIQIFNTVLALDSGAQALLPNGPVANTVVVNHSAHEPITRAWKLSIPKSSSWEEVRVQLEAQAQEASVRMEFQLVGWNAAQWNVRAQTLGAVSDAALEQWWLALARWDGSSAEEILG